ncbi:MAG: hypothetical protein GY953_11330 [bacterium]|nr:hypothetical protein [bacterium]
MNLTAANGQAGCPGAKLRLYEAGTKQLIGYREVTSAVGFVCGPSYTQHFGLGLRERADLAVWFPDGSTRTIEGVPAGRTITVSP